MKTEKSRRQRIYKTIAFSSCILLILAATVCVSNYSLRFEFNKTKLVLIMLMIGVIKRAFLIEVIIITLRSLKKTVQTHQQPSDNYRPNLHKQNRLDELSLIKVRLDQLMAKLKTFETENITEDAIKKNELRNIKEKELANIYYNDIVNDFLMFLTYLIVLLLIVLGTRNPNAYYSTQMVKAFLNERKFSTISTKSIYYQNDVYTFIKEKLLINFHRGIYYSGKKIKDPAWLSGETVKLLGVIRLRQLRLKKNLCSQNNIIKDNKECIGHYVLTSLDKTNYSVNWKSILYPQFSYKSEFWRLLEPWHYQTAWQTKTLPRFGDIFLYPGGGYIVQLGRNYENSIHVLSFLQKYNWLDERTVVVFMEFTLYNVDANIFNIVTICAERNPMGIYKVQTKIDSTNLLLIVENLEWLPLISVFLYIITTCIFFYQLINKIIYAKFKKYITNPWNLVDTILTILNLITVILFFYRNDYVISLLEHMSKTKNNEFISFYYAAKFDFYLTFLAGLLIFMATIRIWKILQFSIVFRIFTRTLFKAWFTLFVTTTFIVIFIIGFSMCCTIINGSNSKRFITFVRTMTSLLAFSFGFNETVHNYDLEHGSTILGTILYFILSIVLIIYLLNMFITIICYYFASVKEEMQQSYEKTYTFWKFLKKDIIEKLHIQQNENQLIQVDKKTGKMVLRLKGGGGIFTKQKKYIDPNYIKNEMVKEIFDTQFEYLNKYITEELFKDDDDDDEDDEV